VIINKSAKIYNQ